MRESKEEIELEREKIALQREKLQQIRESKQVKPETAPQPEKVEAQVRKDVPPASAQENVTVNVNQAAAEETKIVRKSVMIANAKTYFSDSHVKGVWKPTIKTMQVSCAARYFGTKPAGGVLCRSMRIIPKTEK